LIDYLHQRTGVVKDKVQSRINKMIKQGKITEIGGLLYFDDPSKMNLGTDFDEMFEYGPIKIARKGNIVSIQSNWNEEDHERYKESVRESLPDLERQVNEEFNKIESIILEKYDPLDVLAYVTAKNSFMDPNVDTESSFKGRQLFPEIVQNIILKNEIEKYKIEPITNDLSQFDNLLKSIDITFFYYLQSSLLVRDDLTPVEKDVFSRVLLTFLLLRGDAYPIHYKQVSLELFSKVNSTLKENGFMIEEYWATVDEIKNQIENNYNEPISTLFNEHSKFIEFAKEEEKKGTVPEEIIEKYRKDLDTRREIFEQQISKLKDILQKGSFEIKINEKISLPLLNFLSMEFGENIGWKTPLDKSYTPIKPIIKVIDNYYCFLIEHLIRNSIPIIEDILTESEKTKLDYSKMKGDYFEEKALYFLGQLIDGQVYHSLEYPPRTEIDGIIVKDDLVFLVEIKGKKKRIIAGVEDILKLTKDDFEAHINDAFEQTKRAYEYIESREEVEFRYKDGSQTLKLRKDKIKKTYLITVSLASFSELALDINLVKSWDSKLLEGDNYPWIVNIYDLMVLHDLFGKGNESFIDYLDQRIEIIKTIDLKAVDELDFIGYYSDYGSLTKTENIKAITSPLIHGYSEKIDRWYSYLNGDIEYAEKPTL